MPLHKKSFFKAVDFQAQTLAFYRFKSKFRTGALDSNHERLGVSNQINSFNWIISKHNVHTQFFQKYFQIQYFRFNNRLHYWPFQFKMIHIKPQNNWKFISICNKTIYLHLWEKNLSKLLLAIWRNLFKNINVRQFVVSENKVGKNVLTNRLTIKNNQIEYG